MNTIESDLSVSHIVDVAVNKNIPSGFDNQPNIKKLEACKIYLEDFVKLGGIVYGVTTGLGSSSKNKFTPEDAALLQKNLIKYHGCGVGPALSASQCRATLLLRIHCLSRGYSGVRPELISHLKTMLKSDVIPWIPSRGSVGASGDLTPLSYVAAAASGERYCYFKGKKTRSASALEQAGLKPWVFEGREALALMNGTSVMTAVASLAWSQADAVSKTACQLSGLLVELLQARSAPFFPEIHQLKGHKGQIHAAEKILSYIHQPVARIHSDPTLKSEVQDVYSLRCSPQIIGVLNDALIWTRQLIETEANSINDNPIFIPERELVLNGGNFFGGHIAVSCDTLKTTVANVVNLADRQFALMMEKGMSGYLTENLVSPMANRVHLQHGFKGIQITMSAICAEVIKRSQPMSIYSRSTESRNQDVVSMGTTAALELDALLQMSQKALSILGMAIIQGFLVLEQSGRHPVLNIQASSLLHGMRSVFPGIDDDCELDESIESMNDYLFGNQDNDEI